MCNFHRVKCRHLSTLLDEFDITVPNSTGASFPRDPARPERSRGDWLCLLSSWLIVSVPERHRC